MTKISKKPSIIVMAAGMGSRFGGIKQIEPIGPHKETITEFSLYDAKKAGFKKAVIVLRKESEREFRDTVGKRIENIIETEYAYQNIPEWRRKPLGTAHAVMCAEEKTAGDFAVINADDFYGANGFSLIYSHMTESEENCMVGFKLGNTLTKNGTVNRGICTVDKSGYLISVDEICDIGEDTDIPYDTVVSMNMWGLRHGFFSIIKEEFNNFLTEIKNPMSDELYLPDVLSREIAKNKRKIKVLFSPDKWYGITYKGDADNVRREIAYMVSAGLYPDNLSV